MLAGWRSAFNEYQFLELSMSRVFCDEAATGGPIQVVKVVALPAMAILDRQDEHKEESINCCRDFPYIYDPYRCRYLRLRWGGLLIG